MARLQRRRDAPQHRPGYQDAALFEYHDTRTHETVEQVSERYYDEAGRPRLDRHGWKRTTHYLAAPRYLVGAEPSAWARLGQAVWALFALLACVAALGVAVAVVIGTYELGGWPGAMAAGLMVAIAVSALFRDDK